MCSKMLLISLSFFGTIIVVCARPGYSSLSQAILSSMTDLWNEKQAVNALPSADTPDDWWDLLDNDNVSENESSDDKISSLVSYQSHPADKSSYAVRNDEVKSDYVQFPRKKKPTLMKPVSKQTPVSRNIFIKSPRPGPGPLHRALYNSNPLSFEELLHYYDYLDYSYEDSCEDKDGKNPSKPEKPQFTDTIESMLTKFVSTLTGLVERPVVVQANVCCSNPPAPLGNTPNLIAAVKPTEPPVKVPPYIGNASLAERYASNQEDLVKQLKDQYDKMVRLVEAVGQIKTGVPEKPIEELKPELSTVTVAEDKDVMNNSDSLTTIPSILSSSSMTDDSELPVTTVATAHSAIPVKPDEDIFEPTTSPPVAETTFLGNINPKDAVEIFPVGGALPEMVTELPIAPETETTVKTEVSDATETSPSTEEVSIATTTEPAEISTTLKRKRRNAKNAKSRTKEEKGLTETKTEILPTTQLPNAQDLDSDMVIGDVLESKTLALDTMVLNDIPIVEHIHDSLLDREKKSPAGEWQPSRSVKGCDKSSGLMSPGDEKIIAEPPDFIEMVEK